MAENGTTHIAQIGTVIVPVSDQDQALAFYVEKLGFEKRADIPFGKGDRWVEVAPPGADTTLALMPPQEECMRRCRSCPRCSRGTLRAREPIWTLPSRTARCG